MKSFRMSAFFMAVVIAISVTAVAGSLKTKGKLLVVNLEKGVSSFNVSKKTRIFFKSNSKNLSVLLRGEVFNNYNNQFKSGNIDGKRASLMNVDLSGTDVVFEEDAKEDVFLKTGSFDKIASLQKSKRLSKSKISYFVESNKIKFLFSKKPSKIRTFYLSNPSRIVFDFIGITGILRGKTNSSIRYANHPSGCRVVVETKTPKYFSFSYSNKEFELNTKSSRNLFASFKVKTKKMPVKVAEAKKINKPSRTEIKGFLFVGENPEILKIEANKKLDYTKNTKGNKVTFVFKNAFVSKEKEQLIDATSLNGAVKELAVFNDGNNVKVVAKMNSKKFDIKESGTQNNKEIAFLLKKSANFQKGVAGFSETHLNSIKNSAVSESETMETVSDATVNVESKTKHYRGKRINLEFKDADIVDILRLIAEISKLNIIAGDDVKGTVTVRLINIPWDEALDVILKSKSLGKERYGDIIRVSTLKTLQREKEAELAKAKAQRKLEPLKVRLIAVNYARAKELMPKVKDMLTSRGTVSTDDRTNVLIIKDVEEVLDKSEQLVQYLDTQTPQVFIEARIVEATSQAVKNIGVEWGQTNRLDTSNGHTTGVAFPYNMGFGGSVSVPGPAAPTSSIGFSFGSIGNISDLNLTLNVMESEGRIKIVSSPKVTTLDNTEAMIQQGVSIPITTRQQGGQVTTKYVDATLILKTTPHITADGSILMKMNIKKSEPDWSNSNYLGEPAIIKKEANTDVLVKSGDTVVIGGVYTNKKSDVTKSVPFFSDIPVLGWLFKSNEKKIERSELLIFLTPRIVNKVKTTMPLLKVNEE